MTLSEEQRQPDSKVDIVKILPEIDQVLAFFPRSKAFVSFYSLLKGSATL